MLFAPYPHLVYFSKHTHSHQLIRTIISEYLETQTSRQFCFDHLKTAQCKCGCPKFGCGKSLYSTGVVLISLAKHWPNKSTERKLISENKRFASTWEEKRVSIVKWILLWLEFAPLFIRSRERKLRQSSKIAVLMSIFCYRNAPDVKCA